MIIVRNLKILPEFENEIRRLTEDEFKNLTERILEDGAIREKIIVWEGTDYIVDGHHRYKIAMEYNIPFDVLEMAFDDERDARRWININAARSKGRLLNPNERTECIGRSYLLSKKDHGASDGFRGNQYEIEVVSGKDCHLAEPKTEEVIAKQFGVSERTVRNDAEFVTVLDEIKEKTGPEILEIVRSESKKTPVQYLEFINNEVDNNPVVLDQVFDTEPHLRTKWIKFYRGKVCNERNDDVTVQNIADRFGISKTGMEDDLRFARILLSLPEDIKDWIMSNSKLSVENVIKYFEDELPNTIEAVVTTMIIEKRNISDAYKQVKEQDPEALKNFEKYGNLTDIVEKNARAKMKAMFGNSSGGCIMPNAFEMWCTDCEFGFDTFRGKETKFCPYCGQSNIEKRDPDWYPEKVD